MRSVTVFCAFFLVLAATATAVYLVARKRKQSHEAEAAEAAQPHHADEAQGIELVDGQTRVATASIQPDVVEESTPTVFRETLSVAVQEPETTKSGDLECSDEPQGLGQIEPTDERRQENQASSSVVDARSIMLQNGASSGAEDVQQQEVAVSQRVMQGHLSVSVAKRRRDPINRGGRPRGTTYGGEASTQFTLRNFLKPEVVCWKKERMWFIGIELPTKMLKCSDLEIRQGEAFLFADPDRENRWILNSIRDQVLVQWTENGLLHTHSIAFDTEDYLLFKLSGQDLRDGRRVRLATLGSYLVVAGDAWERDETMSGPPPVAPEFVAIEGYRAHFFDIQKNSTYGIVFRSGGKVLQLPMRSACFTLIGHKIEDASEGVGPLFSNLPTIRATEKEIWKEIRIIVLGEEGHGRGKWRTQFSPDPSRTEQELPSEILDRRGGWYFIRFYDENEDLVESLDFRFLLGLQQIETQTTSPLPFAGGHKAIRIQLSCEKDVNLYPLDNLRDMSVDQEDGRIILTVPAKPDYDMTRWRIGYENGPQVTLALLVDRVWWGVAEENSKPSQWKDKPLDFSRDMMLPTSNTAIWLRLPQKRWIDKIGIGFKQENSRYYDVGVGEKEVSIPLRDFSGAEELNCLGKFPLKVWISQEQKNYEGILGELVVKAVCNKCNFASLGEADIYRHIQTAHLNEFFAPLNSYQELRSFIYGLPHEIYKCAYCDFYAESGDPASPTSKIQQHIDTCHWGATVSFRTIDDVNEIREKVMRQLPIVYRCELCANTVRETNEARWKHLIEKHKTELYSLR